MDVVTEFYSKPQVGGAIRVGSRRMDAYTRFGIPIHRNRVGQAAQGVAEAVKAAGGESIKKFVREAPPKDGEERELKAGSNKFKQMFVDKPKGGVGVKSMDDIKIKKKTKKKQRKAKHRRSAVDDVLGDDSY
jgi:hypothetical protein